MKEKGQISPLRTLIYKLVWAFVYLTILVSLCFSGVTLFEKTNYGADAVHTVRIVCADVLPVSSRRRRGAGTGHGPGVLQAVLPI